MNRIGYFEIQSSDPQREIRFYQQLFGWTFTEQPRLPVTYYRMETPGLAGGLLKRPTAGKAGLSGSNAFVCSVQVTDFDGMAARIVQAGGQVFIPKFAIPGRCWQGYFLDPDQNAFGLFQPDEQAR